MLRSSCIIFNELACLAEYEISYQKGQVIIWNNYMIAKRISMLHYKKWAG